MKGDLEETAQGAGASVFSAVGMTLLGTTCCALPITLVALGAGGAVASMASTLPWLVALSEYKLATFGVTAAALRKHLGPSALPISPETITGSRLDRAAQGLEFYYNIHLAQSVDLSLDLQWSESAFAQVDDAVILGARLDLRF